MSSQPAGGHEIEDTREWRLKATSSASEKEIPGFHAEAWGPEAPGESAVSGKRSGAAVL